MAYVIDQDTCTGCAACEPECPNDAISEKDGLFVIDKIACTECEGQYDEPQCVAVCPIDDCVTKI